MTTAVDYERSFSAFSHRVYQIVWVVFRCEHDLYECNLRNLLCCSFLFFVFVCLFVFVFVSVFFYYSQYSDFVINSTYWIILLQYLEKQNCCTTRTFDGAPDLSSILAQWLGYLTLVWGVHASTLCIYLTLLIDCSITYGTGVVDDKGLAVNST